MHQSLPGIVIRNLRYIGRSFARGLQNTVPMPCKRSSQMTSFFSTQTIPIFTDKHHPEILRISTNGIIPRSYTTRSFLLASAPIPPPSPNADTNSSGTLSTSSTITHDSSSSDGGRSSGNRSTSDSGKYIFSALTLLTFTLGCWQSYRYTWKVSLLEERKHILDKDPVDITNASEPTISSLSDLQRVQLSNVSSAVSSNTQLFFIGPRPPPKNLPSSLQTQANAGYLVIEPIQRKDKTKILLLRGWVPADMVHSIAPLTYSSSSSSSIVGIVRQTENPNLWSTIATTSPTNSTGSGKSSSSTSKFKPLPNPSNQYIFLDISTIAQAAGFDTEHGDITTILIESLPTSPVTSLLHDKYTSFPFQRDSSTLYETHTMPFTHGVYALTWFSLAIAGIFLTRQRFRSNNRLINGTNKSTRNRRNIGR